MPNDTAAVIEAQVDYLTCSSHSEERSLRLDALADYLLEGQEALGNRKLGFKSMGYIGSHCGDIDWGRRDERSSLLRVSGGRAAELLTKAVSVADNFSRLDLAVTWRAVPADPHLGENVYSLACAHYAAHRRAARPEHKGDADGGYTMELGNRRSPYYARVYNKEAERRSENDAANVQRYQGCWRYEVEAHDSRALAIATTLVDRDERGAWVQSWLYDFFTQRGIPPAFPHAGADAILPGFHRRTDDESSLRHLERNVRPTLKRLTSHGRLGDARNALGLDSSNQALTELERILTRYGGSVSL